MSADRLTESSGRTSTILNENNEVFRILFSITYSLTV